MRNIFSTTICALLLIAMFSACEQEYIDPITPVDPGSDEAAPSVTLNYPRTDIVIPFTENETDIEFDISVTDDIEIQTVSISLDGTQIATFDSFKDYRKAEETYLSEAVEVGDHSVVVTATDLSGKETTSTLDFEVTNKYVAKANEVFYMPFEGDLNLELISEVSGQSFGTGFAAGISGQAIDFDGVSQTYLLYPGAVLSDLTDFTVSYWVKAEFVDGDENGAIDGMHGLFGLSNTSRFWGNFHMFVENGSGPSSGGDMRIHTQNGINDPTYTETWINPDNISNLYSSWTNHVVTYDNTAKEFKYYVDGSLFNTTPAGWSDDDLVFASSGQIVLGCAQFMTDPSLTSSHGAETWAGYFTGQMDEIRIFDKPLSASEVTTLYTEVAGD